MSVITIRKLVERLVKYGNADPFNAILQQGDQIPTKIVTESWSPKKKEKVQKDGQGMGYEMVDHVILDDYDLVLWHTDKLQDNPPSYVISINNDEHNPLDSKDQLKKQTDTAGALPLAAIKKKVSEWVEQHESVVIGSTDASRNTHYLKIFKKTFPGYKFSTYWKNDFKYGFRLSK